MLIAISQIPKLFGIGKGTPFFQGLASPELWKWQGLVVGLVTMTVMLTTPRITKKLPAAILGILSGIAAYFILSLFSPGLLDIQNNPLIIGPIQTSGSFLEFVKTPIISLFSVDFASVRLIFIPALTLSVLLSIDTLQTCVVVDSLTRKRHNSNRELLGQGVGNLLSCLIGGMPGAGTNRADTH